MPSDSALNIAITFNNKDHLTQALLGNGIAQNVKFLYDLLLRIGHKPYFLVPVRAEAMRIELAGLAYKAHTCQQALAMDKPTNLVLEVAVPVGEIERKEFRSRFGAKIVSVRFGHSMFMDMEEICHQSRMQGQLYVSKPDRVWASPHFKVAYPYLETVYQAPVRECPFIWEPDFVRDQTEPVFKEKPNIYVMEPNLSVLKNALIPMAIIENLYRKEPGSFDRAFIVNGTKFNQQPYFLDNIVRNFRCLHAAANKVYFTARASFKDVFKERDVLIGHQMGCELNYLYMEALYRNIPLLHNSRPYQSVGFYYRDCDVFHGRDQLLAAVLDRDVQKQKAANDSFLSHFSINNPVVQDTYVSLIRELEN